ncbi:hypothetical protein LPTSP4_11690 [Leptospira ryugenii]|uniref:Uncharacterized protein n=1 Tax=Leptospira ryugenii TaxID=1917863 RepID=A0A2P2DYE8_9LEPT|nr:hypothetical protein LPTSP4_11690 [Leptospira ryugenii]
MREIKSNQKTQGEPTQVRLPILEKKPNLCLVAQMRYGHFDSEISSIDTKRDWIDMEGEEKPRPEDKIDFLGVDPEFLVYLKTSLPKSLQSKIQIIPILYGVPNSLKDTEDLKILLSPKSFEKYALFKKQKNQDRDWETKWSAYTKYLDHNTEVIFLSENWLTKDFRNCEAYLYFTEPKKEADQINMIGFLLSLGILPKVEYRNDTYSIYYRAKGEKKLHLVQYSFGYRKALSWLFLPTLGLMDEVTIFDKQNNFEDEAEDLLLDSLSSTLESNL